MIFAPQISTEYEILFIQFCSTKYKWRSCTAYTLLLYSCQSMKGSISFPLSTDLLQTSCCTALQFCKTSTTLIILGLIDIISRCYTKPRLLNTTAAFFLICYSVLELNKTKAEFLSAVCIAFHNSASHTKLFYFSEAKPYWQVSGRQGKTHQNFFPP